MTNITPSSLVCAIMSNHFAHGYALLIGVGTTAESRWSLPVTVKDVQALKTVLIDPNLCAYLDDSEHIRLLQNQQTTRSAILDGLTWLKEKAATDRDATIVVFYSGHGGIDTSTQCYYLVQHDFNSTDIANTALSAQEFTEALRQIQAKRLWVVIDSCHAEGMATAKGELPADFIATALPKGVVDALKQGEGPPLASGIRFDSAAQGKVLRYWVDFAQKYGGYDKDAYKTYDKLEAEWQNLEGVATTLREIAGIPGELKDPQAAQMLIDLESALYKFLWFRGYWDEGVRLGEWRYQAGKALSQWSDAGWGAYYVALIHYSRADTDGAASWAAQMAEAMKRGGSRRDKAFATRLPGLIAQQRQNWVEAERLYQEALAIYRELEDEEYEAITLNDLGAVARLQGNYDRAESYYKQALAIQGKLGNKQQQATGYANRGNLALARNRPTEARPLYERELALAQEVGHQSLVAHAQSGLARSLEEEGRYAEALPLALAALKIQERLRDQNLDFSRQLVERLRRKAGME